MKSLLIEKSTDWLKLTLNRPQLHNALDAQLCQELIEAFKAVGKDKKMRAVFLHGAGPSFCAGGDLNWMQQTLGARPAQIKRDSQHLASMYEAIFQCPLPVVVVAHGHIMGGGIGLLAVADIVVAESASKFCLSETKLGLVPSIIAPYILQKTRQALPYMLTAASFNAEQAKSLGLVDHLVTSAQLADYGTQLLQQLQANGPQALQQTKQLMRRLVHLNWRQARELSITTNAQVRASGEGQEGMRAFLEKRPAQWRHR